MATHEATRTLSLLYKIVYLKFVYLFWIVSVRKYCKGPKYYDQDCSFSNLGNDFLRKFYLGKMMLRLKYMTRFVGKCCHIIMIAVLRTRYHIIQHPLFSFAECISDNIESDNIVPVFCDQINKIMRLIVDGPWWSTVEHMEIPLTHIFRMDKYFSTIFP